MSDTFFLLVRKFVVSFFQVFHHYCQMTSEQKIATAKDEVHRELEDMIKTAISDPVYELEARLGTVIDNKFVSGVDRQHMDLLIRSMNILSENSPDTLYAQNKTWQEEENYYYSSGNKLLRTRVTFENDDIQSCTIQKIPVKSIILKTHVMDVRISLSKEHIVQRPPSIVSTSHVRLKQCRTFHIQNSPYRIDCSMIWCDVNKVTAEQNQTTLEPRFEIECEFIPSLSKEWIKKHSLKKMSKSLLFKISDIMMSTGIHYKLHC